MPVIRHLSRAPITEALIDIRMVPPKGFEASRLSEARRLLKDRYPTSQEQKRAATRINVKVGEPVQATSEDFGLHGILLRSSDEKRVAQFRMDGFTFNLLRPYTSWNELLPEALHCWERYLELVSPETVTRIGVRFINHLPLRRAPADLEEFIVTGPNLPALVPDAFSGFASRVVLENFESKLTAIVSQSLEAGVKEPTPTLLLDIDAFRTGDFAPQRNAVEPVLTALHDYKNQIFFGSLTDTFAESFE